MEILIANAGILGQMQVSCWYSQCATVAWVRSTGWQVIGNLRSCSRLSKTCPGLQLAMWWSACAGSHKPPHGFVNSSAHCLVPHCPHRCPAATCRTSHCSQHTLHVRAVATRHYRGELGEHFCNQRGRCVSLCEGGLSVAQAQWTRQGCHHKQHWR